MTFKGLFSDLVEDENDYEYEMKASLYFFSPKKLALFVIIGERQQTG